MNEIQKDGAPNQKLNLDEEEDDEKANNLTNFAKEDYINQQ